MPGDSASTVLSTSSCYSLPQSKLLRVCTSHAPSQPPSVPLQSAPESGCPQECSQTSDPSVCPNQEVKAPGRRRRWTSNCPRTPLAGNPPTSPSSTAVRGGPQQDTSIPTAIGQEALGPAGTEPPHPALQPHRLPEGEPLPGGCPPAFPCTETLHREGKEKGNRGSCDSSTVPGWVSKPSFRNTRIEIKINRDDAEYLCPR